MSIFRGKVFCSKCGRKHKYKKRAKKPVYVCSTYDNYGSLECDRNQVAEEELVWYVFGHLDIEREEVTPELVKEKIDKIIVDEGKGFSIYYVNGDYSLSAPNKIVR